jgi:hypothetical protein
MLNSDGFFLNLHNFVLNPFGILLNLEDIATFVQSLKRFFSCVKGMIFFGFAAC